MPRWKKYTICNIDSFFELLRKEERPDGFGDTESVFESLEGDEQPTDKEIREAGFDPEDEELCFAILDQDWNGHKAGAKIIHGLTIKGHPFAVETARDNK